MSHEEAFSWYDKGGVLPAGKTVARNDTDVPEQLKWQESTVTQIRWGLAYIKRRYGRSRTSRRTSSDR